MTDSVTEAAPMKRDTGETPGEPAGGDGTDEVAAPMSRPLRGRWVTGLALLLAVALVAAGFLVGRGWHQEAEDLRGLQDDRAEVTRTAEDAARLLVGLNGESGDATLAELRALATGAFAEQVDTLADTVAGVLEQGEVDSQGDVAALGVEQIDTGGATVLVAATSLVSNTQLPQGELRTFRMAVRLQIDDGTWKVSDVEFLT